MIIRRACAWAMGVVLAGGAVVLAVPAEAEQFRYWTYWTSTQGQWNFSPLGPAFRPAAEATVEGWRLEVAGVSATKPPRVDPGAAADQSCADIVPADGVLLIPIVIDFGTSADAPEDQTPPQMLITCVQVPRGSTGFDVLRSVVQIRSERGFVCGLNDYPSSGCGRDSIREEDPASGPPDPEIPASESPIDTPTVDASTQPAPDAQSSLLTAAPPPEPISDTTSPRDGPPTSVAPQPATGPADSGGGPIASGPSAEAAVPGNPSSPLGPLAVVAVLVVAGVLVGLAVARTRSRS